MRCYCHGSPGGNLLPRGETEMGKLRLALYGSVLHENTTANNRKMGKRVTTATGTEVVVLLSVSNRNNHSNI